MKFRLTAFNILSNLLFTLFNVYLVAQKKKKFYVSENKQYYKRRGTVNSSTTYKQDGGGLKHLLMPFFTEVSVAWWNHGVISKFLCCFGLIFFFFLNDRVYFMYTFKRKCV